MKRTYTEEEIAAEEARFGGTLPNELRRRLLEGVVDEIVVRFPEDGGAVVAYTLTPSTTTTDKKGRAYPTPGMTKETEEVRGLLPEDALVAWAHDGDGNHGVVMDDGRLMWWWHDLDPDEQLDAVDVDWDPSPETFQALLDEEEAAEEAPPAG